MDTRRFLKHIIPVYLTRALANATTPQQRSENLQYAVQLKHARKPKAGEAAKAEIKATFFPLPAVNIDLSRQPAEKDWSKWANKDGSPYDPLQNVECKILDCLLRNGLPEGGVAAPESLKRKRKADKTPTEASPAEQPATSVAAKPADACPSSSAANQRRKKPKKDALATAAPKQPQKRSKKTVTVETPPKPPPATFKLPRAYVPPPVSQPSVSQRSSQPVSNPTIVTIDDSSEESDIGEGESGELTAVRTSIASAASGAPPNTLFVTPAKSAVEALVPGESIAPSTLRDLRAASTLFKKTACITIEASTGASGTAERQSNVATRS
ncbi:hypothetical protein LTR08_000148 [Meristemomyces frigidus]|nr:hypothetical protein LTR08_000148 [Meristemomyces frigidus]